MLARAKRSPLAKSRPTYGLEHVQRGDGNAFGPTVDAPILNALVAPLGPCASVQQYADQEKVEHPLALLRVIDLLRPRRQKVCDSVSPTNAEMLVPAMARDGRERGIVVTLHSLRLAIGNASNHAMDSVSNLP